MNLLEQASLIITPNAYSENAVFTAKPINFNDGFIPLSRATTATRVNSSGNVNLVPYNLLQYSQDFDNAVWNKVDTTITANTTVPPIGFEYADTMSVTGTTSRVIAPNTLTTGIYTLSVWMRILSGSGTMRFNLTIDGVNTSVIFSPTTQWQRFTTTFNVPTTATLIAFRAQTFVGDVAIWGAQLVQGTSALDYFFTTDRLDVPRIDYSLGGCPTLLLEPQRTNLILQSSFFDNASWSKSNSSIAVNTTTSPSGLLDADSFIGNGTAAVTHTIQQNRNVTNGTVYTFSFYAKKNTNNFIQVLGTSTGFGVNNWANFDLNLGVVGSKGTSSTSSIESVGNGWYRCIATFTATSTVSATLTFVLITSASSARQETNALSTSVFLWGAQFEVGRYATSLIPTITTTVTRNTDILFKGNMFSEGYITSAGGTWLVDIKNNKSLTRDADGAGIELTDNSFPFGNSLSIRNTGTGRLVVGKRVSSVYTNLYTTLTDDVKIVIKWNGSTASVFVNGSLVVSSTSFTATSLNSFQATASSVPFYINKMIFYPIPLDNGQCTVLSTI